MLLWRRCLTYSKITLTLTLIPTPTPTLTPNLTVTVTLAPIDLSTINPRIPQLLSYKTKNYPCRRCSSDMACSILSLFLSKKSSKVVSEWSVGIVISATVCATALTTSGLCVLRRLLHACKNIFFCQNDSIVLARLLLPACGSTSAIHSPHLQSTTKTAQVSDRPIKWKAVPVSFSICDKF